jgi:predicted transcriptional regulator
MSKENPMANDIGTTFKMSEDMESALSKLAFDADRSKSEIIRACVCLALPVIKANQSLIYRLDFSEFNINK